MEPIEIPLRRKYTAEGVPTPKFHGKKRKASNEGGVGKVLRRAKRCILPGTANSRKRKGR